MFRMKKLMGFLSVFVLYTTSAINMFPTSEATKSTHRTVVVLALAAVESKQLVSRVPFVVAFTSVNIFVAQRS